MTQKHQFKISSLLGGKESKGTKALLFLTALSTVTIVLLYIYGWVNALSCPLTIGYEGPNLYISTMLSKGVNIYDVSTLSNPPWSVTIYPPIFFMLVAPFQAIFGWNLWSGRLVSIISSLVTAWATFRVFRISGSTKLIAFVTLSTFLSYYMTWSWSFFGRVDMLSMAFSVLAIERFLTIYEKQSDTTNNTIESKTENKKIATKIFSIASLYLSPIIFSTLAVFSKQPSVVIPAAISFFLLFRGKRLEAFTFGILSFLTCLVTFIAFNVITDGGFYPHMRFLSGAPATIDFLWEHTFWFGIDLLKIIVVPILALVWFLKRTVQPDSVILLPTLLAVFTGAITLYTLGTEYAHINHAFHFIFALAWLSAEFAKPTPVLSGFLMLGTTIAAIAFILSYGMNLFYYKDSMGDTIKKLESLTVKDKVILTEEPTFALASGSKPLFVDLASFIQVWKGHGGSMDEVIKSIEEKKYPLLIVNAHDAKNNLPYLYWSKSFIGTVWESYQKSGTLKGYRKRLYFLFVKEDKTPQSK